MTPTPEELLEEAVRLIEELTSIPDPPEWQECNLCYGKGAINTHRDDCPYKMAREFVRKYREERKP